MSFVDVTILSLFEIIGDFGFKGVARAPSAHSWAQGIFGYIGVIYYLIKDYQGKILVKWYGKILEEKIWNKHINFTHFISNFTIDKRKTIWNISYSDQYILWLIFSLLFPGGVTKLAVLTTSSHLSRYQFIGLYCNPRGCKRLCVWP